MAAQDTRTINSPSQFKLGSPEDSAERIPTEYGVEPPVYLQGWGRYRITPKIIVPKQDRQYFEESMRQTAKAFSMLLKRNVEWHFMVDNNCSVWGDFGWFMVDIESEYWPTPPAPESAPPKP